MAQPDISYGAKLCQMAEVQPDAPAVSCGPKTLTYQQLHRRTNRLARGLATYGVKAGNLVTLGLPNDIGFIEACWAIWKLGATPQPVSFRLPTGELEAIIALAAPPVVIAEVQHKIDRPILTISDIAARSEDESDLEDRVAPVNRALTSGGSTGRPKLILAGRAGLAPAAMDPVSFWRMRPREVSLVPAPLYHTSGFAMMVDALTIGAHLVIMPRFDPEATLAEIAARGAACAYLVPTMMGRIWRLPEAVRDRYDVSSIKTVWHLSSPCPPWLKEAFIHWLGPDVVMERYGGAESQAIAEITGAEWLAHRGSVGRVIMGEMKVFDEAGQPALVGQTGEIYLRRPQGAAPTYSYVGAEARTLPDGWESLGDMGWFDGDGFLYLADRRTDMVLVGGANVYPAEIEAALEEHPAVQSCAVVGLPDDDLGNQVHAIIQARSEISADELKAFLADRLVTYKRPRSYEFVDHPLRDDAGKMRRTALRDERIARMKTASSAA